MPPVQRHPEPGLIVAPVPAGGHPRALAEGIGQPLADVALRVAGAGGELVLLARGRGRVAHVDRQHVAVPAQRDLDHAARGQARDAVEDRVLQQRLQHQPGHRQRPGQRLLALPRHPQAFAEAQLFDREVALGQRDFLRQRRRLVAGAQRRAEEVGQVEHGALGALRVLAHQAGDGVHAVEQEVRADARLQRIGLGAGTGAHLRAPGVDRVEVRQHGRHHHQGDRGAAGGEAPHGDVGGHHPHLQVRIHHEHQRRAGGGHPGGEQQGERPAQRARQARQPRPREAEQHGHRERQPQREPAGRNEAAGGPVGTAIGRQRDQQDHQLGDAEHRRQPGQPAQVGQPRGRRAAHAHPAKRAVIQSPRSRISSAQTACCIG